MAVIGLCAFGFREQVELLNSLFISISIFPLLLVVLIINELVAHLHRMDKTVFIL